MTARRLLAATATILAATAPQTTAATCRGITDTGGDAGIYVIGNLRAPTPAPSLDIINGTIEVGARTTTFRIQVADLTTQPADGATGADWQWLLKTKTSDVYVVARLEKDNAETFVHRNGSRLYTGTAAVLDVTKDTITWTVPTATFTKAGLTRTTTVSPTISTWRFTVPVLPGVDTRLHADFADGRSVPWGRVGC